MGAIEAHGVAIKECAEAISTVGSDISEGLHSIATESPGDMSEGCQLIAAGLHDIAEAIREHAKVAL
jgi:hypothetical protein